MNKKWTQTLLIDNFFAVGGFFGLNKFFNFYPCKYINFYCCRKEPKENPTTTSDVDVVTVEGEAPLRKTPTAKPMS